MRFTSCVVVLGLTCASLCAWAAEEPSTTATPLAYAPKEFPADFNWGLVGRWELGVPVYDVTLVPDPETGAILANVREVLMYHTSTNSTDTDGDGIGDYKEVITDHTDPESVYLRRTDKRSQWQRVYG
jgi:hypothetical protein